MGRFAELCGEVAASMEEDVNGLTLPPEAWDRFRSDWQEEDIEDAMGRLRFIVFYLLCGVAAAMAQILSSPGSVIPMVGASGAIAGVLGGYALLFPRSRVRCLWVLIIFITTIDVPGAALTEAFGINPEGEIVGSYVNATGTHGFLLSK